MIPLLGAVPVTVQRYGTVTRDATGAPVRPTPVTSVITATVNTAPARDLRWLPDGLDSSAVIKLVTYTELRTAIAGVCLPDRLSIPGQIGAFDVLRVERSPTFLGQPQSWMVYATRVQERAA
jgi:hypothetical protein